MVPRSVGVLVVRRLVAEDDVQGDVEGGVVDLALHLLGTGAGREVDLAVVPAQVLSARGDQLLLRGRGTVLEGEENHVGHLGAGLVGGRRGARKSDAEKKGRGGEGGQGAKHASFSERCEGHPSSFYDPSVKLGEPIVA